MSTEHTLRTLATTLLVASLALAACGDDDPAGALGSSCDITEADSCIDGLVCADDGTGSDICQLALGESCDLDEDPSACVFGSACIQVGGEGIEDETGDPVAECRVPEGGVCDPTAPFCAPDLVCDPRDDDAYGCYVPVVIEGLVIDSTDESAIEGAHVISLDDESVAVTDVAISDESGAYQLELPAVRDATDPEGRPVTANYTLRAQADGYQTFPGGIRTALPISTDIAVAEDEAWVISGALTTVVLIPLPNPNAERYSVAGSVVVDADDTDPDEAGVLVVLEAGDAAYTAISDRSGGYVVFNVPPGDYDVAGYAANLQLEAVNVSVVDEDLTDVDLLASDDPTSTVSGTIQIVNGSGQTSIIFVVASTFQNAFGRGETPRGLRAPATGPPSITGAWTIAGVPDGRYVILAAFENDDLVRDPDLNIGGTETITIELPDGDGTDVNLAESFKVTEALDVVSPGTDVPEAVTSAPDLVWQNDTSEDWYEVRVFNAFGDQVWENLDVPAESGQSPPISVTYGGPLEPGMYYQFRALSWRQPSSQDPAPISATEDLRGVFFVSE